MMNRTSGQANRLLGYPADARLLLINADDFGMCHAVNAAICRALTAGLVRSTEHFVSNVFACFVLPQPANEFGVWDAKRDTSRCLVLRIYSAATGQWNHAANAWPNSRAPRSRRVLRGVTAAAIAA